MTITYDEKLKNYMTENNVQDLVLDVTTCSTWAGIRREVSARFAEKNEHDNLILNGYSYMESEQGKIYYKNTELRFTDNVLFKLVNLYWTQQIVINGVRTN